MLTPLDLLRQVPHQGGQHLPWQARRGRPRGQDRLPGPRGQLQVRLGEQQGRDQEELKETIS